MGVRTHTAPAGGTAGITTPGLRLDPRVRNDAVAACRAVAGGRFADLMRDRDAATAFVDGRDAQPDGKGFRRTKPEQLRDWVRQQLRAVTDRLGLPVPVPVQADGGLDVRLRNWPVWAVGTEPLTALADLQAAESLQLELSRAGDATRPVGYRVADGLRVAAGPDVIAYARFRRAALLPPCFVAAAGSVLVTVSLPDLPAVALAAVLDRNAPPSALAAAARDGHALGPWLRRALVADPALPAVSDGQAVLLLSLLATGAGDREVAVLLGWLGGPAVTRQQASAVAAAVMTACQELRRHLADRSLDQLAAHFEVTPAELAGWCGGEPGDRSRSFLPAFVASGFAERFPRCPIWNPRRERLARSGGSGFADQLLPALGDTSPERLLAQFREHGFRRKQEPLAPPPEYLMKWAEDYASVLSESVTLPGGRRLDGLGWVEARSAFLDAAGDAVLAAATDLHKVGHTVAAVTPDELVVEVSDPGADPDAIARVAAGAVARALGGLQVRAGAEVVDRW